MRSYSLVERLARVALVALAAATAGLVLPHAARAQQAADNSHSSVAAFDETVRGWIAKHAVPRASIAVMRNGRLVFAAGYGGRGANERVPVWSLSKAITALCVASFVEDRKLRFDDPVGPLLAPAFAKFGQPADPRLAGVTVAQLITHRSGLPRVAVAGDNKFAPGLNDLLRQRPPREATAAMLMPRIVRVTLARDPGADYEYSNIGYLLLGQIVEALSGKSYEAACGERVLARAGIKAPALDPEWGGIMQAAAGWALSGPEYLGFARLLEARRDLIGAEAARFIHSADGKWSNGERTIAYTLGVQIRPLAGQAAPNLFHSGGNHWNQVDVAGGPLNFAKGTTFGLAHNGVAWFASFDGFNGTTNPEATTELDRALWRLYGSTAPWPKDDQFPEMGVGAVAKKR